MNDAIVQCYTAVLNSITEVAKRCIFLGPITSHGWDDQEILQNLNNYYAECQDSIEFGLPLPDPLSFNIDYRPPNDRRHRILKGNIGAKYVSGQYMNTEEIFELGFKAAYFCLCQANHWFGVYCWKEAQM